jgi:hypothetical protein
MALVSTARVSLPILGLIIAQGRASAAGGALDSFGDFAKYLQDPIEWLQKFWTLLKAAQVPEMSLTLAATLLIFGIVWSGYRIAAGTYTGDNPYMLMMRLCVAAFLVIPGSAGTVSGFVRTTWTSSMAWGFERFAKPTVEEAGKSMEQIMNHAANVGSLALGVGTVGAGLKAAQAGATGLRVAGAAGGGTFKAASGVANTTKAVGLLALPIMMTYYVIVLVTGFTVLMSSIMLPVAGAMIIFPGSMGMEWFGRWLRTTLSAVMLVAFMALVFAAALQIGFIAPANAYSAQFSQIQNDFGTVWNKDIPNPMSDFNGAVSVIGEKIVAALQAGFNMVVNFVLGLLMMIIGIIAGIVVLNNAYSQITAFIGGAISGSGAAQSGTMIGRAMAGMSSPRGGGSGRVASSASSSSPGSSPATGGPANGGTSPQTAPAGAGSSNNTGPSGGPSGGSFVSARPSNT